MVYSHVFKFVPSQLKSQSKLPVALVTGASQGIGFATVKRLAEEGYVVYATSRTATKSSELRELKQQYPNIKIRNMDIGKTRSVKPMIRGLIATEGVIDLVVNNAAYGLFGSMRDHTVKDCKALMNVNTWGVKRVIDAVLPVMEEKGRSPHIVTVGSIASFAPDPYLSAYALSKLATRGLVASYKCDFIGRGKASVRYTVVQPGAVLTNFVKNTLFATRSNSKQAQTRREEWEKIASVGQSAADVAKVIVDVIKNPNPPFWKQTSLEAEKKCGMVYRNTQGFEGVVVKPENESTLPRSKL